MTPGTVVICATTQAGTVLDGTSTADSIWVLTRSLEIWVGNKNQCRTPQDQADLDACPVEVPRLETKPSRRR